MKRKRISHTVGVPAKKARRAVDAPSQSASATPAATNHPVLQRLYPHVSTLRHYLLSRLHTSSKNRRRRISQLGTSTSPQDASSAHPLDADVAALLDSTLVGVTSTASTVSDEQATKDRDLDVGVFTQRRNQATSGGTFNPGYFLQAEVCILHHDCFQIQPFVICTILKFCRL